MEDGEQIRALIHTYAERLDEGDLDGVAELFEHSTWRTQGRPQVFRGVEQVRRMYDGVILHDGRPGTKHVITNVSVVAGASGVATARSYFTVLQATPELPLQPIIAGSYHDEFARVEGSWRFSDRLIVVDLVGDLSRHLRSDEGTPAENMNDEAVVDALDVVWTSLTDLGGTLSEPEWATETECPGWTVQDNLAHIIGIEATILGRPAPDHEPAGGPHVKNDVGASNEVWVDWYRQRSGADVLADFHAITRDRLGQLRAPDFDLDAESWTPVGPGTVRELLGFRIFDSWIHEQDVRRALHRPGDDGSRAASESLDRIERMMPMVVGKKVAPPDGTVVAFTVEGPVGRSFAIGVDGGRAAFLDPVPAATSVHLGMETDTFVRLGSGRGDPESILASGAVVLTGDLALGRRVATSMNFLF